ncbi:MAG: amidoligase, partial [Eubacteriales bacterium]|nr:amidoligase [Eubacteriales bacterium]
DRILAYIQLCLAISAQALHTKAASPTRPVTDNPKYAFRCWLLKLGFIGDEFKTAREVLIRLLPGNSAWRQAS